ncbi:cyclin-like f-box [Fusarium phyllophilum]|uniref:Cyclin-like f-box n=1 Tax=Fusarium phyllophilum TaxID=47803 RepID=A0A8H5NDF2_9HYPO|nr:cyclin-like f-box [Fusarium phyllophilum]
MLSDFPNEIQCQIIRLLDPVGLISLSQSSRYFRRLINPQKRHLVERLLQVELLPEHGGPTLTFRSRDSKLEPSWQDEAWESMRWACTDCLRLLPHKCFDNQSLLRLGYRKPFPQSDAARMVTTWEHRPDWQPERRLMPGSKAYRLEKSRRELYFFAVTKGVMCDVEGDPAEHLDNLDVSVLVGFKNLFEKEFRDMDNDEQMELFGGIALSIENEDCGKKRILDYVEKQGTVGPKDQSQQMAVSDVHGPMHQMRELARDSRWIMRLLNERLTVISSRLCQDFNSHHYTPVLHLPQVEAGEWRVLLEQTPWFNPGDNLSLLRVDLDLITTRRRQWKDLLDRAKERDAENSLPQVLDELYDEWVRNSEAIESEWKWLMDCKDEIEENPELLVDWTLERDGAAFT